MNSVALFLPNWIGDVVMATPAIRAIRNYETSRRIVAVCKPYVAELLSGSPWFEEIILFDRRGPREQQSWSVAGRLRELSTESAVLFSNSFRPALIARVARCREIIGYARYGRGFLLTKRLRALTDSKGRYVPTPIIDDYNRLAMTLGTQDPGRRMELYTTLADTNAVQAVWDRLGLNRYAQIIGLNPGAAFGAAKHWPMEHFASLARKFTQGLGCGVVVMCGPTERHLARRIAETSRSPHVYSLAEEAISLGLSKAIVQRLSLLITTDSGPRHFAAAFDRPVITLFGPTFIEWTETFFSKAIHIQKKVPCGPCQRRICPLDHRCMRDIYPDEVFTAAERLLACPQLPHWEIRHAG